MEIIIICKIVSPFLFLPSEIKELNKNVQFTHFDFKFGDKLSKVNINNLKEDGWKEDITWKEHGLISYYHTNKGAIRFEGFPDLSNKFKFTTFYSGSNNNVILFGVHIGDSIKDAQKTFKSFGYTEVIYSDYREYSKKRITIIIDINHDKITTLSISLKVTDWFHRGYNK